MTEEDEEKEGGVDEYRRDRFISTAECCPSSPRLCLDL